MNADRLQVILCMYFGGGGGWVSKTELFNYLAEICYMLVATGIG